MTAPVGSHVGEVFKSVWDTMIELLLIRVGLRIRFADTFSNDLGVAFFMACIFAILALHTSGILQELSTKSTTHDIVELLEHKFMAVKFMDLFFALADGTFTIKTNIEGSSVFELFC